MKIILSNLKIDKKGLLYRMLYWGETSSPELVKFVTMTQKLRIPLVFLLLSVLVLSSLAFQVASPFFQIDTPTPAPDTDSGEADQPLLESDAGSSDGITLLGILIFLIILAPIWALRKVW
jgi:hypothetical protein